MSGNDQIIEEFRANNGRVGGMFEGASLAVLTTMGARTGRPHVNPVVCHKDGDRYLVFASNAGGAKNPDWFHNLLKNPQVTVEVGTEEGVVKPFSARAEVLEGEERDRCWQEQCTRDPVFREYEERAAGRTIPVVALRPLDLAALGERRHLIGIQLAQHHQDLRDELARVRAAIDAALSTGGTSAPPAAGLAEQLRARCLTYCYGLQLHHVRENGAFTAFEGHFPHLAPVVARLRAEHEVVEAALAGFEELLGEGGFERPEDVARLRKELDRVVNGLEEHFRYEEETLLPALDAAG